MNCGQARDRCHRRADGGGADAALDAHLAGCEQCRRYDTEIYSVMAALDALRRDTEGVRSQTRAGIRPVAWSVSHRRRAKWIWLSAAVAAALLIAVGLTRWRLGGDAPVGLNVAVHPEPDWDSRELARDTAAIEPARPVEPRLGITLQGDSAKRYLAVARPTSQPNVQVYWLYPLLEASAGTNGL